MSANQISENLAGRMPILAVMGVDGSGKSSLIERLESKLIPYGVKGVHVLARVDNNAKPGDIISNHQYPPRSLFVSVIKIAIRSIGWLWQYYRLENLRSKGCLVVLDRFYFFDMLIDPLKYRYSGPLWLVRNVADKMPKPNFYILLDAPEQILLSRKQEVQAEEISRQRKALLDLFHTLPDSYILNAANDIDEVVEKTINIILEYIPH